MALSCLESELTSLMDQAAIEYARHNYGDLPKGDHARSIFQQCLDLKQLQMAMIAEFLDKQGQL